MSLSLDGLTKKTRAGDGLTYSWDKVNVYASTSQGFGKKKVTQEKHILKDGKFKRHEEKDIMEAVMEWMEERGSGE